MEESVPRQEPRAEACALPMRQGQLSVAGRNALHALAGSGADVVMMASRPDALGIARLPLIKRLLGKAMALCYRLVGKDRYDDFRLERVYGMPFIVTPSVFNPKVPRTGEFFASQIDSRLVNAGVSGPALGR